MARHGYIDDDDGDGRIAMWRGRVASAIRGKRGQKMLRELRDALDAMPDKRLVAGTLQAKDGDCCAIGAVCRMRGIDLLEHEDDDPYDLQELNDDIAAKLDVATCLVQEVEYINDEWGDHRQTDEARWRIVRNWVEKQINPSA
jgi:hypothetical protein